MYQYVMSCLPVFVHNGLNKLFIRSLEKTGCPGQESWDGFVVAMDEKYHQPHVLGGNIEWWEWSTRFGQMEKSESPHG